MTRNSADQPKPHARWTRRKVLTTAGILTLAAALLETDDQVSAARGIPINLPRPQRLNKSSGGHLAIGPPPESGSDAVHVFEFGYGPTTTRSTAPAFKSRAKFQLSNGAGLQLTPAAGSLSLAALPPSADAQSITPLTKLADPAIFNGSLRLVVVRSVLEDSAVLLAYARASESSDVLLGAWKTPGDFDALDFYSPGSNRGRQFDLRLIGAATAQVPWVSDALHTSASFRGVANALLSNNETGFRAPELQHHGLTEQLAYIRIALDASFPAPTIGQTLGG